MTAPRFTSVDRAMLQLVHLVMVDELSADEVGRRLRAKIEDPRLLRQLAARVATAAAARPSRVADRAAAALQAAMAQPVAS